jgi:RNA polymerase sigma factor (sigma-70 family)
MDRHRSPDDLGDRPPSPAGPGSRPAPSVPPAALDPLAPACRALPASSVPPPELDLHRLMVETRAALRALFRASGIGPPDAEDILQESLMIVLQRFRDARHVADPPSFLLGTAKKRIQQHFQRRRRERLVGVDVAQLERMGGSDSPQRQIDSRQDARKLLAKLPRRSGRIVEMRYGHGLSSRDIARQAGGSESSVRKMASRGLQRLRRYAAAMRSRS